MRYISFFLNVLQSLPVKPRESPSRFEAITALILAGPGANGDGEWKKEGSDHLFPDDRCRRLPPDKGKLSNCVRSNPVKMKPSGGLECFVLSFRGDKNSPSPQSSLLGLCMCNLVPLQPLSVGLWISNDIISRNCLRFKHSAFWSGPFHSEHASLLCPLKQEEMWNVY